MRARSCRVGCIALAIAASGCNETFGLRETERRDAAYFDAPIDAAYQCPPIGTGAPEFSPYLFQHLLMDCLTFTPVRSGRAVAACTEGNGTTLHVFEGPTEGPLTRAIGILEARWVTPRMSQDGQRMYVVTAAAPPGSLQAYQRGGDGTWIPLPDPPISNIWHLGAIADGATGDLLFTSAAAEARTHEWVNEAGTYRELRTHSLVAPGSTLILDLISPTSDGLRGVATASSVAYYTDRPSLTEAFRPIVVVPGSPRSYDYLLLDDCSRLYGGSGLGSVMYAKQR